MRYLPLLASLALLLPMPARAAAPAAIQFPPGFLWGAATAAHQVEGHMTNDWVDWEHVPGHVAHGDTSALGTGSYERYDQDFALAEGMGHTIHRMSVEWARIEPRKGVIDQAAVAHYHQVFASLRKHHMLPMVTLFHFTNPVWVAEQGGWLNQATVEDFGRFAAFMGKEFHAEVPWWCTLNEPNVYGFQAYDAGNWPPAHKSRSEALHAMANLFRGHALAYRALHAADPHAMVGVANHIAPFDTLAGLHPLEAATAYFNDDVFNHAPLRAQATGVRRFTIPGAQGVDERAAGDASCIDFLGVNYYTRWVCVPGVKDRIPMPNCPVTAMGWEDYPEGMVRALKLANAYSHLPDGRRVPLVITENGVDDPTGATRPSYMVRHLAAVKRAIDEGVDVRGYIHWTLIDNYEWAEGYRPKFGLYQLDRAHGLARVETPAVPLFRQIASANGIDADTLAKYTSP